MDSDMQSLIITAVAKGGPCDKAGIRVGERIRAVDGDAVMGKDLVDVFAYELRGAPGSRIRLELTDANNENARSVDVVRVDLFNMPRDAK